VPDTYDEKYYTKILDYTTITKEQRDHAEKVAHLIEKTVTNNVHLKEERGQTEEIEEENWNEEDRFSGVIRQPDEISVPPENESIDSEKIPSHQNLITQREIGIKKNLQLEIPTDPPEPERQEEHDTQIPDSDLQSSNSVQTPSALRATAVEFVPTPNLKQGNPYSKPELSPRSIPPTVPVSVLKPKGNYGILSLLPPALFPLQRPSLSDTSSIISTPDPQQFPPFSQPVSPISRKEIKKLTFSPLINLFLPQTWLPPS
jgi:hypothetical protein